MENLLSHSNVYSPLLASVPGCNSQQHLTGCRCRHHHHCRCRCFGSRCTASKASSSCCLRRTPSPPGATRQTSPTLRYTHGAYPTRQSCQQVRVTQISGSPSCVLYVNVPVFISQCSRWLLVGPGPHVLLINQGGRSTFLHNRLGR